MENPHKRVGSTLCADSSNTFMACRTSIDAVGPCIDTSHAWEHYMLFMRQCTSPVLFVMLIICMLSGVLQGGQTQADHPSLHASMSAKPFAFRANRAQALYAPAHTVACSPCRGCRR